MTEDEILGRIYSAVGRHGTVSKAATVLLFPDELDDFEYRRRNQEFALLKEIMIERERRSVETREYIEKTG